MPSVSAIYASRERRKRRSVIHVGKLRLHPRQPVGAKISDSKRQAGAFLTTLTLSGLEASPEIVAACAQVLRDHAIKVENVNNPSDEHQPGEWDYRDSDKEGDGYTGTVDIVGTGGDGWDTFNVSTTSAVVVAGTGVRVAKVRSAPMRGFFEADDGNQHGSKAATSTSGSADLLLSLECRLSFPPSELPGFLPHSPFLFLFAPHYHPSLAHIAPIRRQLNFRTVFNILGPLINPARPSRMLLGVAKRELGETFAEVLRLLDVERALVVCGKEGLDEISPQGETWVSRLARHSSSFADRDPSCRRGGWRRARSPKGRFTRPVISACRRTRCRLCEALRPS